MTKKRYLYQQVTNDLNRKLVLLSGPRQVGKTTLSKSLLSNFEYLNFDNAEHRGIIKKKEWRKDCDLLILDELHKMKDWKRFLKGLYDVQGVSTKILVTGSARLDIAKKMGDSLAGRYFAWKLHPFDIKELKTIGVDSKVSFKKLLTLGGFPEPYFSGELDYYKRWATTHLDIIIRQDLIQLERVTDLAAIEYLIELLSNRVGSTISYESLAREIERDATTVKRWITILENLFIVFKVTPWNQRITKASKKSPKYYFYDTARVRGHDGQRLENLVACALVKELDYLYDSKGIKGKLHFLRTRDNHELDFLVAIDNQAKLIIETKWSDNQFSPHFKWFGKFFNKNNVQSIQLVGENSIERENEYGTKLLNASDWLEKFSLI